MAERSGWGTATDKPTGGGSDPNVLKLEDQTRFRILDPGGPVKWRQHYIESPTDPDQGRSGVCPRGYDGRHSAPCPCCMKPVNSDGDQQFNVSRRFATNVWDYASGSVKVLIGGPKIFQEFDAQAKAGIDPTSADWTVIKSGTGKSTQYQTVRMNTEPFTAAAIGPDDLHDLDKYADPDSPERMLEMIEAMGIDYDALELPSYTLAEAERIQMPYGKHKGLTIEQLYANEKDYLLFLYSQKRGDGNYGDPIFVAMHTVLSHYGDAKPLDDMPGFVGAVGVVASKPNVGAASAGPADGNVMLLDPAGAPQEVPRAAVEALLGAGYAEIRDEPTPSGMKTLVGPDGNPVEVPQAAVESMLAVGFTDPTAEPEPAPVEMVDDTSALVGPDGSETPTAGLPDAAVQALLAAGHAYRQVPGEAAAPEPAEPADDDEVTVEIGGTSVSMPYGSAKGLIASEAAKLLGPAVAQAAPVPVKKQPPRDDEEVTFKLKVMPSAAPPVKMKWSDASRLYNSDDGDFADNAGSWTDEELRDLAIPSDAAVREEAAAAAARDPHPHPASPSAGQGTASGGRLDGEAQQGDDGKWTHPALDKGYATKGSATQALNRLRNAAEAAESAQPAGTPTASAVAPEGKSAKMELAKKLVSEAGIKEFKELMDLFEEVAGEDKRNIADFSESDLDALIAKLS